MEYYNQKEAFYYAQERREMAYYFPQELKNNNEVKVLDVGCSQGHFGSFLKTTFGWKVYGIELHEPSYNEAKRRLDIVSKIPLSKESFGGEKFDVITFNDVLEHIEYPWTTLENCKTLLKKDGFIIASIPNLQNYVTLKDLFVYGEFEYKESGIMDKTHLRFFTKKSIINMFETCGYRILVIKGEYPIMPYSRVLRFLNFLSFGRLKKSNINFTSFNLCAKLV